MEQNHPPPHGKPSSRGFTLIEILVAVSILAFMTGILASITGQASNLWMRNESQSQIRERARTALDLISHDLKQAVVPLSASNDTNFQFGPKFCLNPGGGENGATYNFPNSLFWYAPVASETSMGDLALVGYYLRPSPSGGTYDLCRLLINPSDASYTLDTPLDTLLTSTFLDSNAPAGAPVGEGTGNTDVDYKGLVFKNVLGLWITVYPSNHDDPYKLPDRVDITMVFVDDQAALKADSIAGATGADPRQYIESLPAPLKAVANMATTSINFMNR